MIKVNNVVKTFDGFRALDGLTMEVEKGSIYGLVGPNGAGKSTILRHITGIYRPDSGTITVDGAPVYENPAVKSRVAFIPDDLYYHHQNGDDHKDGHPDHIGDGKQGELIPLHLRPPPPLPPRGHRRRR